MSELLHKNKLTAILKSTNRKKIIDGISLEFIEVPHVGKKAIFLAGIKKKIKTILKSWLSSVLLAQAVPNLLLYTVISFNTWVLV